MASYDEPEPSPAWRSWDGTLNTDPIPSAPIESFKVRTPIVKEEPVSPTHYLPVSLGGTRRIRKPSMKVIPDARSAYSMPENIERRPQGPECFQCGRAGCDGHPR